MAAFGNLITTNKGINLHSKVLAGVQLVFTRIAFGDGELGGSQIANLNSLKHEVKSSSINKLKVMPEGKAVIGTVLSNQNIPVGFYMREIGIFAEDPQEGEILYCYSNAGSTADYIPPGGSADIIEREMDFILLTANSSNVSAVINSSLVYASASDLLALEQKVNDIQSEQNSRIKIIRSPSEPTNPDKNMLWFKDI